MHYIVTFHKRNKTLSEAFATLDSAKRWKELVKKNGYIVDKIITKGGSHA